VIPSGVTAWSGDDWRKLHLSDSSYDADPIVDKWGFADVEAAIEAIPQWMKQIEWTRQGVDMEKWVVSGHSNGGQGAWYALTHR
jgi:hypothetical protein